MPARIAAGVGQTQQFEVAHDVLIERPDLVKGFEEIERDVRLELVVGLPDARRSSFTPSTCTSCSSSLSVSSTSCSVFQLAVARSCRPHRPAARDSGA